MLIRVAQQQKGHLLPGGGGRRGVAASAAMAMGLEHQLQIRLPEFNVLRLVARSLLAVALISFHLLRGGPHPAAAAAVAVVGRVPARSMDDALLLPMLFRDLERQGLLRPGGRAMFLGRAAGARVSRILMQNKMELVTGCESVGAGCRDRIPDGSLDFVFSDAGGVYDAQFVDRVLKAGGVAAVRLGSDPGGDLRMVSSYKIVYVRKLGSTVVAIRKAVVQQTQNAGSSGWRQKRLLAVPETRKEALDGLEDVLLEPPTGRMRPGRYLKRTRYLPDLMGDTLDNYPRRVFVEVAAGSGGKAGAAGWFARNYPTRNRNFEVIRVEIVTEKKQRQRQQQQQKKKDATAGAWAEEQPQQEEEEMSGWLRRNVREEEYVVMKAEAGVVEGMVRSGAVGLVDELFLQCGQGRGAGPSRRRAYWECLALYGRLRDAGVAVHQWWWG